MHKLDTVGPVFDHFFLLWAPVDIHDLMIFIFYKTCYKSVIIIIQLYIFNITRTRILTMQVLAFNGKDRFLSHT